MLSSIGLCLASRNRPERFGAMYASALSLADDPSTVYFAVRIDADDSYQNQYRSLLRTCDTLVVAERSNSLCKMVNEAFLGLANKCDIYSPVSDDLIFRTPHWDTIIRNTLNNMSCNVGLIWGDGGTGRTRKPIDYNSRAANWANSVALPTWLFMTKEWINVLGYFLPPYFLKDYGDTWFLHLISHLESQCCGDHVLYLENTLMIEHMHPVFGKAAMDSTYAETQARYGSSGAWKIDRQVFDEQWSKREEDSKKLVECIKSRRSLK